MQHSISMSGIDNSPADSNLHDFGSLSNLFLSALPVIRMIVYEVAFTVAATFLIFSAGQAIWRNFRVVGSSMVDNLHDGQYLTVNKLAYYRGFQTPQRGDVIVFRTPPAPDDDGATGHSRIYIKRVIGLPGDKVQVIQNQVLINGSPLDEPFSPKPGSYYMPVPAIIPEGYVFVLGDNRDHSHDSHIWGPLPIENIIGRVWISYWPFERWGKIPRDAPATIITEEWLALISQYKLGEYLNVMLQ